MRAAIGLRGDISGDDLRRLSRNSRDAKQVRRLLALAVTLDGGTRTEATRVVGAGLQIVRESAPLRSTALAIRASFAASATTTTLDASDRAVPGARPRANSRATSG